MTTDDVAWRRLDDLLGEFYDADPDRRRELLDELERSEPDLASKARRLVAAAEAGRIEPGGALEAGVLEGLGASAAGSEDAEGVLPYGGSVGPWRLLEELGRGGMGVVYLAERADGQFDQRVALKLMPAGPRSEALLARFEQERQILARLEHPNIARLVDGGVTEDGAPWFAMEHVAGERIDGYCDRRRLPVEHRLALFTEVADAVQAAHRNLVVHRDLKPANILVTEEGTVKLLDFGIAKPLEGEGGAAEVTRTLHRILTPEYATPEQIRGDTVTTASDVYQLGLLLHELLTGRRAHQLSETTPRAVERAVCEEPPTRPSVTVVRPPRPEDDGGEAEELAAARRTSPKRLRRRLRGDLDTIVLTALRKEPERRYASAEQMAADVRRHLDGLPVVARADTFGYRALKFASRHAAGLASAVGVGVLIAGLVGFYSVRLRSERDRARIEAAKAEQVARFLGSLLENAQPDKTKGEQVTVLQLLEEGAERVDGELASQPEVQARMLGVISDAYFALGDYARSEELRRRELDVRERLWGLADPRIGRTLRLLGEEQNAGGDPEGARESLERALALHDPGPEGAGERGKTLSSLGIVLRRLGRFEEALDAHERSLPLVERSGDRDRIRAAWQNYGNLLLVTDRYGEAANAYERALKYHDDLETMRAAGLMANLGMATCGAERPADGLVQFQRAREIFEKLLPPDHPSLAKLYSAMGECSIMLRRYEDAFAMQHRSLEIFERALGPDSLDLNYTLIELGDLFLYVDRLAEAERYYRRALDVVTRSVGDSIDGSYAEAKLGTVSLLRGDADGAEDRLRQALAIQEAQLGHEHVVTNTTRARLGIALARQGRLDEAGSLLREALEIAGARGSSAHEHDRATLDGAWGEYLVALGRLEEAEPLLLSSYRILEEQPNQAQALLALERLQSLYEAMDRPSEATRYGVLERQTAEALGALRLEAGVGSGEESAAP